tara:strand:- start:291 stop:470 length:180 start_codon:yes stop_codon:yes gene_type:complete
MTKGCFVSSLFCHYRESLHYATQAISRFILDLFCPTTPFFPCGENGINTEMDQRHSYTV